MQSLPTGSPRLLWGKSLAHLESPLSPQLPLLWLLVKRRPPIREVVSGRECRILFCMVMRWLENSALYGKSFGGLRIQGARCVQKGGDPGCKRGWGAPTPAGDTTLGGSSATSPLPQRGAELLKSNPLKQLGAGFWVQVSGWAAEPGVAELAWLGRKRLFAGLCVPFLAPGVYAGGCVCVKGVSVCVCVRRGVYVSLCVCVCKGGCARTVPALFCRSSAPSLLCYPLSAPSGICASSLSPIVRNFFSTVWAGDRF